MARTWPFVGPQEERAARHGRRKGSVRTSGKDGRFSAAGSGRYPLSLLAARRNVPGRACRRPAASLRRDSLRSPRSPAPLRPAQRRLFRPVHGPRRLLDHHLPAADARAPARRRERAPAPRRTRGPARRRRPRRPADGLGAAAPRELERTRRRAALRGRSRPSSARAPAQRALAFGAWLVPADAAAVESGARAAQAARRGLSPDRALPRRPLHRRRGPHHRRARDPAPARRDRRPVRAAAGAARSSPPRAATCAR